MKILWIVLLSSSAMGASVERGQAQHQISFAAPFEPLPGVECFKLDRGSLVPSGEAASHEDCCNQGAHSSYNPETGHDELCP